MPPTVPVFADPQNTVQQQSLPNVRVDTSAPAEAFGGGQALSGLTTAAENLGTTFSDVAQKERDRADQIANIQADTAASKLQTQLQVQVSKMRGQDAFQAPDFVDQNWQDGVDKIREGLSGRNQQLAFDRATSARYQELNKSVQLHVASESETMADQTFQAGIQQSRDSAVVNAGDDQKVSAELAWQKSLVDQQAMRKGIPQDSDQYKQMLTQQLSATHQDVVLAQLDAGLTKPAQQYFNDHKGEMAAGDVLHVQTALENAEVVGESNDLWSDILSEKGMRYTDGSLNGEKIRQYVEENSDLSDQKKLKVLSQVKAMAKEYNVDRYHQISENERAFTNQIIVARQNGAPLDQALLNVGKYATDPYDAALKTKFAQATYAPPEESDVIAHENLREGIMNGTIDTPAIDQAANKGQINMKDWANLRQLKLKTAADGTDPVAKFNDKLIIDMAQKSFGSDRDAMANFQYVLSQKAAGKSPDEKLAIAQEELKKVPDPGGWFPWSSTQKYKLDAQTMQGQATAVGGMYQDLGFKQTQAMASGLVQGGSPQRIQDPSQGVHAFADSLGLKYDDLKVGTPANNAVQSLMNKGKAVTPQSVQAVLKKYPDGTWK